MPKTHDAVDLVESGFDGSRLLGRRRKAIIAPHDYDSCGKRSISIVPLRQSYLPKISAALCWERRNQKTHLSAPLDMDMLSKL